MIGSGAAAGRGLAGTAHAGDHGADDPRGPEEPPALPEEGGTHTHNDGSTAPYIQRTPHNVALPRLRLGASSDIALETLTRSAFFMRYYVISG